MSPAIGVEEIRENDGGTDVEHVDHVEVCADDDKEAALPGVFPLPSACASKTAFWAPTAYGVQCCFKERVPGACARTLYAAATKKLAGSSWLEYSSQEPL